MVASPRSELRPTLRRVLQRYKRREIGTRVEPHRALETLTIRSLAPPQRGQWYAAPFLAVVWTCQRCSLACAVPARMGGGSGGVVPPSVRRAIRQGSSPVHGVLRRARGLRRQGRRHARNGGLFLPGTPVCCVEPLWLRPLRPLMNDRARPRRRQRCRGPKSTSPEAGSAVMRPPKCTQSSAS